MFSKPANNLVFADDKLENAFNSLSEGDLLKKSIREVCKYKRECFLW